MNLRRPSRAALRGTILAATTLIGVSGLAAMLVSVWPPFRGAVLFVAGRASTCSFAGAVGAPAGTAALLAARKRTQQVSRLAVSGDDRFEKWDTDQGPFWILKGTVGELLRVVLPEQAIGIYDADGFGVRSGDIVLDCGAHYGVYTRRALKAGARLVVAIEPNPDNLECLRRNLAGEIAQGRVIPYPKGIWDQEGSLPLRREAEFSARSTFVLEPGRAEPSASLPLTTIDKIVAQLKLPRVDYIKMDIEGAERRALAGARTTLARFQPRLAVAVYHQPGDAAAIGKIITSLQPAYRVGGTFCIDMGSYLDHEVTYYR